MDFYVGRIYITCQQVRNSILYFLNHIFICILISWSRKYMTVSVIIGSYVFSRVSDDALFEMFHLNEIYGFGNWAT